MYNRWKWGYVLRFFQKFLGSIQLSEPTPPISELYIVVKNTRQVPKHKYEWTTDDEKSYIDTQCTRDKRNLLLNPPQNPCGINHTNADNSFNEGEWLVWEGGIQTALLALTFTSVRRNGYRQRASVSAEWIVEMSSFEAMGILSHPIVGLAQHFWFG